MSQRYLKIFGLTLSYITLSILFASCLSAAIRAALGTSINLSLFLSLPFGSWGTSLFLLLINKNLGKLKITSLWSLIIISGFAWSVFRLFNPKFDGFPAYNCSDGANHLLYRNAFIAENPQTANGLVSIYGLSYWLEHLFHLSPYYSFIIIFYLFLLGLFAALYFVNLFFDLTKLSIKAKICFYFSSSLTLFFILDFLLLPIISYNQIDGFWAHLFALFPLFWIWILYAISDNPWKRFLVFVIGAIIYRYTYVLNLGDYFLLGTSLSFYESYKAENKKIRYFALALSLAFLLCAAVCYFELKTIFNIFGTIKPNNLQKVSLSLLLITTIIISWILPLRNLIKRNSKSDLTINPASLERLLLFPALFALISLIALSFYRTLVNCANYYPYKYLLHPLILLVFDLFILLFLLQLFLNKQQDLKARSSLFFFLFLTFLLGLAGLSLVRTAYALYLPQYSERITSLSRYYHLKPLTDLNGEKIIRKVLTEKNKKFGGYYLDHWPRYSFVNASFALPRTHQDYLRANFIEQPGYCIFWSSPPRNNILKSHLAIGAITKLKRLEAAGNFEVINYTIIEGRPKSRQIAYRCY